jgi:L-fuculose-phosphate aldolase
MELAFWFTDILDAYCRTLILARQLGRVCRFSDEHCRELLEYKQEWGFSDLRIHGPRAGCNVCGHESFHGTWTDSGLQVRAFPQAEPGNTAEDRHRDDTLSLRGMSDADLGRLAELIAKQLRGIRPG